MFTDCIIMAGGSGTRLWPASTSKRPKQFLAIPDDNSGNGPGGKKGNDRFSTGRLSTVRFSTGCSFFRSALERALAVTEECTSGRVVIVAGKNHIDLIAEECAELEPHKRKRLALIPEPMAMNTAPAIACALLYIDWASSGAERSVLVLTSDHVIKPLDVFKADAHSAAAMAQADKLVVFGIPAKWPETGYGYIETASMLPVTPEETSELSAEKNYNKKSDREHMKRRGYEPEIFTVASFHEKPDLNKAERFVSAKNFYWNSGMFAFSSKFMLAEFKRIAPLVIAPFMKLLAPNEASYRTKKGLRILEEWAKLETAYDNTKAISFDYAIAEKCGAVVMVKAGFSWTDAGTWDEYARLLKRGGAEVFGCRENVSSCFVDSDIPVALCGVQDLIVVVRSGGDGGPPAVLISKKGETRCVKEIVEEIKTRGRTELL